MSISKFQKAISMLLSIFFFGMIGQFLAHTIVMYGLKLPQSFEFIWLWKELVIGILWIGSVILLWKNKEYQTKIIQNTLIKTIIITTIISFMISMLNSLIIHDQSIITFLVSAKFNYIPIIILCSGLLISQLITKEQNQNILDMIITTIKYVLIFSLVWYIILHTIPNILDRIGFAQPGDSIEWTANTPPPSLYLTEFYSWYVRNQGPFWWPLSLWFYLIALWPLFFAKVLYQKNISDTRPRWLLYISIVISTYSRAAWGMFFISSLAIALIIYRKYTKYIIGIGLLLIVWLFIYIKWWWTSEMFLRTRSDKWHLEYFTQWVELIKKHRLRWLWASSVWPGANHIEWVEKVFNPENQYMQIWLEYGLLWLLWRLITYITIIKNSLIKWLNTRSEDKTIINQDTIIFIGIGISIISLWIWGMVLHPFADSSSMYPFMMITGLVLWIWNYKYSKFFPQQIINSSSIISWWRKTWTIWIAFLFTLQTILVSGFHILENTVVLSSIRDILFWSTILGTILFYNRYIIWFIKTHKIILWASLLLFVSNIIYLLWHIWQDTVHIIAWIKYDVYFLVILLSWLWIWHILNKQQHWEQIIKYTKRLGKFIIIIVCWGFVRQLCKNIYPNIFIEYLWFSSPSDFVPFTKPPIYYITWSWWIQRLSGFFVGPNTFWFFLILFSSLIYYLYKKQIHNNKWIFLTYIMICISTFSRGVILWVIIQSIIILLFENRIIYKDINQNIITLIKKNIITLIGIIIIGITSFFVINQWKQNSNEERFWAVHSSVQLLSTTSIFGSWPGYVGPAKHYDENYNLEKKNNLSMLENIYLQIVINQWILWILMFIIIAYRLVSYHIYIWNNMSQKDSNEIWLIAQYLWIWLLSLLWIGRFLHIFIDSMVNYLFFIVYGISLWYAYKNKIH